MIATNPFHLNQTGFPSGCHAGRRLVSIDGAIEVRRLPAGSTGVKIVVADNEKCPLDTVAMRQLEPYRNRLAGQGWETKYRIAGLEWVSEGDSRLQTTLVPLTYEEAVGFQRSLVSEAEAVIQPLKARLTRQLLYGSHFAVPSTVAVHSIVITRDGYILLCRRSPRANYYPSHWSISFEEQLNEKDLAFGDAAIVSAVTRGFQEEFSAPVGVSFEDCTIMGVCLERQLLNLAFCAVVKVPFYLAEIRAWRTAWAKDRWEAGVIASEPFTRENVARLMRLPGYSTAAAKDKKEFHPTAKYRLLLAAVQQFRLDPEPFYTTLSNPKSHPL